jgi:VanZ family protein
MVGLAGKDLVIYVPCHSPASDSIAVWRFAVDGSDRLSVTVWIRKGAPAPAVQLGTQPPLTLENNCPKGATIRMPDAGEPWTLGNIDSGHRPFVGKILSLELASNTERIDLLRDIPWQAPAQFWVWPERLYEPADDVAVEVAAAVWHFASFFALVCLAVLGYRRWSPMRITMMAVSLAVLVNGGKLLIAGRHPSLVDLMLNLAGILAAVYACRTRAVRSL